jgi:large subunit ribosomal protein L4
MKLDILNINGEKTGREIELPEEIFGIEPNEHSLYLAVKAYLANQRQGTHKSKERSEMSGSTRKLHRQKGTGGSRKGDINNPLYYGGARVFGPRPRDYSQKLNKKVKLLARKSALSAKASNSAIFVVEDFSFDAPRTKSYVGILNSLKISTLKSVVVTGDYEKEVYLSSRNLPNSKVVRAQDLNVFNILHANALVLSVSAIEKIKQSFE